MQLVSIVSLLAPHRRSTITYVRESKTGSDVPIEKAGGAVGVKVSEMYIKEISLPSKRSVHFNCNKREVLCTQWRWQVGEGEGEGFTKSFIGSIQYAYDTLLQTQIYDSPYPILVLPQPQIFCSNLLF